MTKEILEILDNIRYWETCPDNYKETIERFLTDNNQALQLHKTQVSGSFLVLSHAGSFVDYNLLPKGIYSTSIPQLFSKDMTIEILEQKAKMSKDLVGNYFVPESYFENLKKCTLTSIDLVELK